MSTTTRSASGCTVIVEQTIVGSDLAVDLGHAVFYNGGQIVISGIAGLAHLEKNIGIHGRAAQLRMIGVQTALPEAVDCVQIYQMHQLFIVPDLNLLHLVRSAEAVKKVQEGHAAFNGSQVGDSAQIHDFLRLEEASMA